MHLIKKSLFIFIIITRPLLSHIGTTYPEQQQLDSLSLLEMCNNDDQIEQENIKVTKASSMGDIRPRKVKDYTILIYMAADNDLERYAIRNIRQMSMIGSTDYINLVIHLDIRSGNKKICSHFYIEKEHIIEFSTDSTIMDSGNPESLISFVKCSINKFPADNYVLVGWNHGTGIIDPIKRTPYCSDLFMLINKFEFDHASDLNSLNPDTYHLPRGICWDDSTGHYLNNQKLNYALSTIKKEALDNKKFAIIAFDACLMSMLEVADLIKDYAHIMVSSQEVELGTGWNYQNILSPFINGTMKPQEFAEHIVNVYGKTYNNRTNDFTLSAVNLDGVADLVSTFNTISEFLVNCITLQKNNSVVKAIKLSRHRKLCTHFETPQYIDLHHFLANLQANLKTFSFTNEKEGTRLTQALHDKIEEAQLILSKIILANVTGSNLAKAHGLSIFYPEQRIHPSYPNIASYNTWIKAWIKVLEKTIPV